MTAAHTELIHAIYLKSPLVATAMLPLFPLSCRAKAMNGGQLRCELLAWAGSGKEYNNGSASSPCMQHGRQKSAHLIRDIKDALLNLLIDLPRCVDEGLQSIT